MRGSHIHGQKQAGRQADNEWAGQEYMDGQAGGGHVDRWRLFRNYYYRTDMIVCAKWSISCMSLYLLSMPLLCCLTAFWLCRGLNVNFFLLNYLLLVI